MDSNESKLTEEIDKLKEENSRLQKDVEGARDGWDACTIMLHRAVDERDRLQDQLIAIHKERAEPRKQKPPQLKAGVVDLLDSAEFTFLRYWRMITSVVIVFSLANYITAEKFGLITASLFLLMVYAVLANFFRLNIFNRIDLKLNRFFAQDNDKNSG